MNSTFNSDLTKGKVAETDFHKLHPYFTHNPDEKGIDFYFDKRNGSRIWVEVKASDSSAWRCKIEHSWNRSLSAHFAAAEQVIASGSSDSVLLAKRDSGTWTLYDVVKLQKQISSGAIRTEAVYGQQKRCTRVDASSALLAQHYKP